MWPLVIQRDSLTHAPHEMSSTVGEIEGLVVDLVGCQMELFLLVTPARG